MSLEGCARIVETGDPARFRVAMGAAAAARAVLLPLYAFNIEVSRAPWVTAEPMIAEMRLQWWRDALDEIRAGGKVRRHEVVDALADVLDGAACDTLDALIAARRWDIYRDGFLGGRALADYLDATSGGLLWVAARHLGETAEPAVRDMGYAAGLARFLQAVPALKALERVPLADESDAGISALAAEGLARLERSARSLGPRARAALLDCAGARAVLRQAVREPQLVRAGGLELSPFKARWALAKASLTGRM